MERKNKRRNKRRNALILLSVIAVTVIILLVLGIVALIRLTTTHCYGETFRVAPTCTQEGYSYRICSHCGDIEITETYPPVGHIFSEFLPYEDATAIYGGSEISVCTVCGAKQFRPVECTTVLPRFYLKGDASGVSLVNSVGVSFSFVTESDKSESLGRIRYLPPQNASLHDYAIVVTPPEDAENPAAMPVFEGVGQASEIRLLIDHVDYLHIRAEAVCRLFEETVAESGDAVWADCLHLADGTPYFGTRVLYYQTIRYMESRVLAPTLADFAARNDTIRYAVSSDGENLLSVYGENAAEKCSAYLESIADDLPDAFIRYFCFCRAIGFSAGLSDHLLLVSPDGDVWYPLPDYPENCLGVSSDTEALLPSDVSVTASLTGVTAPLWQTVEQSYPSAVRKTHDDLANGILSLNSVGNALKKADAQLDKEYISSSRSAGTEIPAGERFPLEEVLRWYQARLEMLS